MLNNKKFIIVSLSISLVTVSSLTLINFLIDPFQIYRKAQFHQTLFMKERYLNAGLIKSFDYDSIVIGSSMTQNFIISDISTLAGFQKPIKLSTSGGSVLEEMTIINHALEIGKTKNILFGFDIFSLISQRYELPIHLYDMNYLNDYKYLVNFDTFKRSFLYPILPYAIPKSHPRKDFNKMYQWQHSEENNFGKDKVIAQFKNQKPDKNFDAKDYKFEKLKNSFDFNILSIIKKHPEVDFIIFYPPYSIITYQDWKNKKILADILLFKKYALVELNKLSNAKLYDFQSAKVVTHNLDNYKDYGHYHQKINTWMIDKIKHNEYRVTEKNVDEINNELLLQSTNWSPLKN